MRVECPTFAELGIKSLGGDRHSSGWSSRLETGRNPDPGPFRRPRGRTLLPRHSRPPGPTRTRATEECLGPRRRPLPRVLRFCFRWTSAVAVTTTDWWRREVSRAGPPRSARTVRPCRPKGRRGSLAAPAPRHGSKTGLPGRSRPTARVEDYVPISPCGLEWCKHTNCVDVTSLFKGTGYVPLADIKCPYDLPPVACKGCTSLLRAGRTA